MKSEQHKLEEGAIEKYIDGALHRYTSIRKSFNQFIALIPPEHITDKMQDKINDISKMFHQHEKEFYLELSNILKQLK